MIGTYPLNSLPNLEENETEFGIFEAEAGYVRESGISFYGRPGIGFGYI
jgi:hypothetical protein